MHATTQINRAQNSCTHKGIESNNYNLTRPSNSLLAFNDNERATRLWLRSAQPTEKGLVTRLG